MSVQPLLSTVNGCTGATINVADRGLAFGDGVFETLLLFRGHLPYLTLHLDRMTDGLARLQINANRENIESLLNQFLSLASKQALQDGIIKLVVTRGEGRGYAARRAARPTIVISLYPALVEKKHCQSEGVAINTCQYRLSYQPALRGIKHLNRLDNVMAAMEAQSNDCAEGLVLDDQDNVAEAISRNVFIVKGGDLLTPDLQRGGINGVMRRLILETLAPGLKLSVIETRLNLQQVLSADEVFLCNSITGLWPVVSIDDNSLSVGSVTQALQQALRDFLERR